MANPTIYYIRHGQTDWNAQLRWQGRRDIPLNELGQTQADKNGLKLAQILENTEGLDFISSPLSRASETMERVRTGLGLEPKEYTTDDRLIEVSYGDLEGVAQPEMKAANRERFYYRKKNPWTFRPEDGENNDDVLVRISAWYESLTKDCVVTAHGTVGRVLRYHLLDLEKYEAAKFAFPQDQICIIRKAQERFV